MDVFYGEGKYIEGKKVLSGKIILGEHKLFLRGPEGELASTFIPLEKIERVKKSIQSMEVYVRPSLAYRYVALFKGDRKKISELVKDLVERRGFKKKFLKNEWNEVDY